MSKIKEDIQPNEIPRYALQLALIAMHKRGVLTQDHMREIETLGNAAIYALMIGKVVSVSDKGYLVVDETEVSDTTPSPALVIGDDD